MVVLGRLGEALVGLGEPEQAGEALSEVLQRATAFGEVSFQPTAHALLASARIRAGDNEGALAAIDSCRNALALSEKPASQTEARLVCYEAQVHLDREPRSSVVLANKGRAAFGAQGYPDGVTYCESLLSRAHLALGDVSAAHRHVEVAIAGWAAPPEPSQRDLFRAVRGQVALAEGDEAAARADLEACKALLRQVGGRPERTEPGMVLLELQAKLATLPPTPIDPPQT